MSNPTESQPETIVLEFVTKGTPGPTLDTQSKAFLVEIHYKDIKHLVRLPRELAEIIPTFSILRIKTRIS
jgi:hypothetical protein